MKLLQEHADRYKMLPMKDMKEHKQFKGDGGDPRQWMELFPYMTTVGDGVIDIKAIVAQAQAQAQAQASGSSTCSLNKTWRQAPRWPCGAARITC